MLQRDNRFHGSSGKFMKSIGKGEKLFFESVEVKQLKTVFNSQIRQLNFEDPVGNLF